MIFLHVFFFFTFFCQVQRIVKSVAAIAMSSQQPVCSSFVRVLGRCYANPLAIATPLCSVGADGNFDLKDCLMECDPGWYCASLPLRPFAS